MALTQSIAYHAVEMHWFAEADKLYLAFAQKAESSNDWEVAAVAYHQLGMIAEEQRDFAGLKFGTKKRWRFLKNKTMSIAWPKPGINRAP